MDRISTTCLITVLLGVPLAAGAGPPSNAGGKGHGGPGNAPADNGPGRGRGHSGPGQSGGPGGLGDDSGDGNGRDDDVGAGDGRVGGGRGDGDGDDGGAGRGNSQGPLHANFRATQAVCRHQAAAAHSAIGVNCGGIIVATDPRTGANVYSQTGMDAPNASQSTPTPALARKHKGR